MTPERNVKVFVYVEEVHEDGTQWIVAMKDNGYIVNGGPMTAEVIEDCREGRWPGWYLNILSEGADHDWTPEWIDNPTKSPRVRRAQALARHRTHGEGAPEVDYDGDV